MEKLVTLLGKLIAKPILGLIDTRSPVENFKKQHVQKVDGRNCRTKERDDGIFYVDSTEKTIYRLYHGECESRTESYKKR